MSGQVLLLVRETQTTSRTRGALSAYHSHKESQIGMSSSIVNVSSLWLRQQNRYYHLYRRHGRSHPCVGRHRSPHKLQHCAASFEHSAVRPVPIKVITVSSKSKSAGQACASEWMAKLSRYTAVESINVKNNPLNAKDTAVAVKNEGSRVLKHIAPTDYVVCLDERGRDVNSMDVARLLADASSNGVKNLVFLIGGPFGHSQEVRQSSQDTIRLSRCVLNHSVAHIVLMEQLYRAWTILKNEPYHH